MGSWPADTPCYDMKFADEYHSAVVERRKTMTIRLAAEWDHVFAGDCLGLCDSDGNEFGEAWVTRAHTLRLDHAWKVADACDGHESYGNAAALREHMEGFYDGVRYDTDVRIIHFSVLRGYHDW